MHMDTTAGPRLTIDVWADVVCPWCYVGEARLQRAVEASPRREDIDIVVHTFQLRPGEATGPMPVVDYLASTYGVAPAQARQMEERLGQLAGAEGLAYEIDRPVADTLDMLRVVQFAATRGLGWQLLRALQGYLFAGHADAFEPGTIVRVAAEVGLEADEVREVQAGDRFAAEVRADHQRAMRLGAQGVPFTVLGDRIGIPGAVSVEQFGEAIAQAWAQVDA